MNIESLTSEIAVAREQFHEINDLHWEHGKYRYILPDMEHRLGELAARLERLYKFRSMISAKA
jgi:hypothetical protein